MATKELARPASAQPAHPQPQGAARGISPFDILQREVDRVFDRFDGLGKWPAFSSAGWPDVFGETAFSPRMEVTESENAIEIAAELPGMDEKDVEISVADGVLTIRGEKKFEKDEKRRNYRLIERSYGAFERAVALPSGVDASKVTAKMAKGVLRLEIPKPVSARARQVKITPA